MTDQMTSKTDPATVTLTCQESYGCRRPAKWVYERSTPGFWQPICGQHKGGLKRQMWGTPHTDADFFPINTVASGPAEAIEAMRVERAAQMDRANHQREIDAARHARMRVERYNAAVAEYATPAPWTVTRIQTDSVGRERFAYVAHRIGERPDGYGYGTTSIQVTAPYIDLWDERQLVDIQVTGSQTTDLGAMTARAEAMVKAQQEIAARWPKGILPEWEESYPLPPLHPEDPEA